MENIRPVSDVFIYICSRNPIVVGTIECLLTTPILCSHFDTWSPSQTPMVLPGVHILLVDVSSIEEWPEAVRKWTSVGNKAILLAGESWGSEGAELCALYLGVHGIVRVSPAFIKQVADAVWVVADGQLFASRESLEEFYHGAKRLGARSTPGFLSFREEQVIDLLIRGFSNKRIAAVLEISERTAKFHVCNILHKLRMKSRRDVVGKDRSVLRREESSRISVKP